jgi:hypothetical protein
MTRPTHYTSLDRVFELYCGIWGAAADAQGADYWTDEIDSGHFTFIDTANSFFDQPRVQQHYQDEQGQPLQGDALLRALYRNIFKVAEPDAPGLAYWQQRLIILEIQDYHSDQIGTLVLEMLDGMWDNEAAATTQALYQNWLTINRDFYDQQMSTALTPFSELDGAHQQFFLTVAAALVDGISATSTVDERTQALTCAMSTLATAATSANIVLTAATDDINPNMDNPWRTGGQDDVIDATTCTLTASDHVDGGAGRDTLFLTMQGDFNGFSTSGFMDSIETIQLQNNSGMAHSFVGREITGTTTLVLQGTAPIQVGEFDEAGGATLTHVLGSQLHESARLDLTMASTDLIEVNTGNGDDHILVEVMHIDDQAQLNGGAGQDSVYVTSVRSSGDANNNWTLSGIETICLSAFNGSQFYDATDFDASLATIQLNCDAVFDRVSTSPSKPASVLRFDSAQQPLSDRDSAPTLRYLGDHNVWFTNFDARDLTVQIAGSDQTMHCDQVNLDHQGATMLTVMDPTATATSANPLTNQIHLFASESRRLDLHVAEGMRYQGTAQTPLATTVAIALDGQVDAAAVVAPQANEIRLMTAPDQQPSGLSLAAAATATQPVAVDITAQSDIYIGPMADYEGPISDINTAVLGAPELEQAVNLVGRGDGNIVIAQLYTQKTMTLDFAEASVVNVYLAQAAQSVEITGSRDETIIDLAIPDADLDVTFQGDDDDGDAMIHIVPSQDKTTLTLQGNLGAGENIVFIDNDQWSKQITVIDDLLDSRVRVAILNFDLKYSVTGDYLFGTQGNDTDTLNGDTGNDLILGFAGDDELNGGDGADYLIGGLGADWLDGGTGVDVMTGDLGADQFYFAGGDTDDVFNNDVINLANVDRITDFTISVVAAGDVIDIQEINNDNLSLVIVDGTDITDITETINSLFSDYINCVIVTNYDLFASDTSGFYLFVDNDDNQMFNPGDLAIAVIGDTSNLNDNITFIV